MQSLVDQAVKIAYVKQILDGRINPPAAAKMAGGRPSTVYTWLENLQREAGNRQRGEEENQGKR